MYIDIVKLATKLADDEIRATWDWNYIDAEDEEGNQIYTAIAQAQFDKLYEKYYNIILKCKGNEK